MTDYEKNGFLKRVVRLFTEDWLRKVIALFVTLALYSIISGNTGQEQTFTRIPVELEIRDSPRQQCAVKTPVGERLEDPDAGTQGEFFCAHALCYAFES